jgi:hypothetical protein
MRTNSKIPSRNFKSLIDEVERLRPAKATPTSSNHRGADRPYGLRARPEKAVETLRYVEIKKTIPPLRFVIDPFVRPGGIYTLTGATNAGTTTLCTMFGLAVATGRSDTLGLDVEAGPVAYVAIQNRDDILSRFAIAQSFYDIPDSRLRDRLFIRKVRATPEGVFEALEDLSEFGSFALVIVDTFAACFDGTDRNDNVAAGDFIRHLREVTPLLGRPAVIVPSHPIEGATRGSLNPHGGDAVLNQVDGNLTLSRAGLACKLHWQTKLRGPNFKPLFFRFRNYSCDEIRDAKGRRVIMPLLVPYVQQAAEPLALPAPVRALPPPPRRDPQRDRAAPLPRHERSRGRPQRSARFEEAIPEALLREMIAHPGKTQKDWASATGVAKSTVNDHLRRLQGEGLVQRAGRSWTVTQKGRARFDPMRRKMLPVKGSR